MQKTFKINNILNGWSTNSHVYQDGQFNSSLGIDPDFPIASQTRTSGVITPTVYEKFSSTELTGFPKWLITNPKNTNIYAYDDAGNAISYDSGLTTGTALTTPTSGAGNGCAYYNNYIYFATPTDVSRYGPLSNSPTMTQTWWTSIGLSAMTDSTYPTIRGTKIPNHAMHVHSDNSLYICDFSNGQGIVNRIHTKKVTYEGDTTDPVITSAYAALYLPFGYYPVDIESYGTDLTILCIQTTDGTVNQGKAKLVLWDPTDVNTFYKVLDVADPLATALLNINGTLEIFSGNAVNGTRLSSYIGYDWLTEDMYIEEGTPPFAGAVDCLGSKVVWGSWTAYPAVSASVFSWGSKDARLPKGLHNIAVTTSTGATPVVSTLKFVQQSSNIAPKLVLGWGDASAVGLDKLSSAETYKSIWRSGLVNVGKTFNILEVRIPLGQQIATGMTITPTLYFDDGTSSKALTAINETNYSGAYAIYKVPELTGATGNNNFLLDLAFTGTVQLPVLVPIQFEIEIFDDEA